MRKASCELGDIALETGDFNQARADYSQALKLQPSDPNANFGMAKILIGLNDPCARDVGVGEVNSA